MQVLQKNLLIFRIVFFLIQLSAPCIELFSIITNNLASMFTLKQVENFNNITAPYNKSLPTIRTLISPQGNFLFSYDSVNFRLYDLNSEKQIPIRINTTINKAYFSLDQSSIIFSNLIGISAFFYQNNSFVPVIKENRSNNITDFQMNENYTILYYINQSQLSSMSLITGQKINNGTIDKDCNAIKMKYDSQTETIITSSLAKNQYFCFICKWSIKNDKLIKIQSTKLPQCVINDIYIFKKQITITKKLFNFNSLNTIILNSETLSTITQTSGDSSAKSAFIVPYRNYYLEYFLEWDEIYVYKDDFTAQPFQIRSPLLLSIQYNPIKDMFYIISKDNVYDMQIIDKMAPSFNCALANNTIYNISNPFDATCKCQNGMLFNKQKFSCKKSECGNEQNPCVCPLGSTFDTFNLKCQLDCKKIPNAVNITTIGTPLRCLCHSAFVWNALKNDCSNINCNSIEHSASKDISTSCSCKENYVWNDGFRDCIISKSIPAPSTAPTIIIDLQNQTEPSPSNFTKNIIYYNITNNTNNNSHSNVNSNTKIINNTNISNNTGSIYSQKQQASGSPIGLIIGLMILFLILIAAAIYFYYRRCKQIGGPSDDPQQRPEPAATDRQLSEKQKVRSANVQSDECLKSVRFNNFQANGSPAKTQKDEVIMQDDNLQNFSIDEDEQVDKNQYFSEIESNIENPLN